MSFSRAQLKRFNEHVGCAPAPGTYDVKSGEPRGAASFHKAERFKTLPKNATPVPSNEVPMSPVRRTMSVDGLPDASSARKDKTSFTLEMKHQKKLEKEMRSLVQQKGEQDRRLLTLEEELKKLESKLLVAVREKTGLAGTVASLERQLGELKKANEFLKTKVSTDISKKKINSLTMELIEAKSKLDAKDKELSSLQINSESKLKVLEKDLEAARSTFKVLQDRNKDLENLHNETMVQNEQLNIEMDKLRIVIKELKEEIGALQSYLDSANEEIQELRLKLQDKSIELPLEDPQGNASNAEKLENCICELKECQGLLKVKEDELQKCWQELRDSQKALQNKEEEMEQHRQDLKSSQALLKDLEERMEQGAQSLEESQSTVRQQEQELTRVKEILRRTEEELDQRVALMSERCMVLESERARTQEEGLRRVQELKSEINSLEESKKSESKAYEVLKEENSALSRHLEVVKVHSSSLTEALQSLRDETEKERMQLGEELEDALEELSELEKQEKCSEDAIQQLTEQNQVLEESLKKNCIELDRKCAEILGLEDAHVSAMKKSQQEHNDCLARLQVMTTEVESTRLSLEEQKAQADASVRVLEEELNHLKLQMQQEQQKLQSYQEKQEEHTRMLLEVQGKLDQKEEELQTIVDSQCEELKRLEADMDREKELEEQITELHRRVDEERSSAQKQAAEWQEERRQLCRQLEKENEEIQERFSEAQLQSACDAETEHWKSLYEELFTKVQPFQEELDRFAMERNALLNENGATQAELNKLAGAYANLMGHQNQRQKIKHIVKLKEENLQLKQETSRLRALVGKQKVQLDQLKASHTPRRFDFSKAFQHERKENLQPVSTLTPGNRNLR